jgi:hypothetical protein
MTVSCKNIIQVTHNSECFHAQVHSPDELQKQMNGLECFCSNYQMVVNTVKMKIVIMDKRPDSVIFI